MSAAEYNRFRQMNLTDIRSLGAWELVRLIEASSPVQRQMILQALGR